MTGRSSALPRLMKAAGLLFTVASLAFAVVLLVRHGGTLHAQWAELQAEGWHPRPVWLLAALAVATGNLFLLGWAWIRLLRELGGSIRYIEGMRVWTWTNLGRYLPGRVWQISALTLYLREKRRIGGVGLGSSLALQVLMLAVGGALAFAVLGLRLADGRPALGLAALGTAVLGLSIALRPSMVQRATGWMSGWMGEPAPPARPRALVLWEVTATVAISWGAYGLSLWLLWRGAGATAGPDLWFWTGSYAAAYLTGYVALFAPAGLVVREGALALLLVSLGGLAAAAAAGIAVLSRLLAVASELAAAALAWILPDRGAAAPRTAHPAATPATEGENGAAGAAGGDGEGIVT